MADTTTSSQPATKRDLEILESNMRNFFINQKEYLNVPETAFYLGISESNVHHKIRTNPHITVYHPYEGSSRVLFKKSQLETLMKSEPSLNTVKS